MTYRLAALWEKDQIIEVATRLFVATDDRDWTRVTECFTDEIWFDTESLTGKPPALSAAVDVVRMWEEYLRPFAAIHHQIGNIQVEIAENAHDAVLRCYGTASHHSVELGGGATRTFVGRYELQFLKREVHWLIHGFKFELRFAASRSSAEGA